MSSDWFTFCTSVLYRDPAVIEADLRTQPPAQPRPEPAVVHTFEQFLSQKAAENFEITDQLKYRCLTFVNAKGFWGHVKALWQMGLLGWLCYRQVSKLSKSEKGELQHQFNFYQRCCRVQELYQNHHDCYTDMQELQEAYEAALRFATGNAMQQDQINAILNNQFADGSSVGAALLEHIVSQKFTSKAGVINTLSAKQFMEDLVNKHGAGYRGVVNAQEEEVINAASGTLIQSTLIQNLIDASNAFKGMRGIFLSYARAYTKQCDLELHEEVCKVLRNGKALEAHASQEFAKANEIVLDHIKQLPGSTVLPETDENGLGEAKTTYVKYQGFLSERHDLQEQLESLGEQRKQLRTQLAETMQQPHKFTLDELSEVIQPDQETELQIVKDIQAGLRQQAQLRTACRDLPATSSLYAGLWQSLAQPNEVGTIQQQIVQLTEGMGNREQLEKQLEQIREITLTRKQIKEIADEKEQQAAMVRRDSVNSLGSDSESDSEEEEPVEGSEIVQMFDDVAADVRECSSKIKDISKKIGQAQRKMQKIDVNLLEPIEQLERFGFKFDENQKSLDKEFSYRTFKFDEYQAGLKIRAAFGADVAAAFRVVTLSPQVVANAKVLESLGRKPNMQSRVSPDELEGKYDDPEEGYETAEALEESEDELLAPVPYEEKPD